MLTKVQRWGNSLGLRIPRAFAEEACVKAGSTVEISLERGRLVVIPVRPSKYRLEQLLAGVNRKNLHAEVVTGAPVGREGW